MISEYVKIKHEETLYKSNLFQIAQLTLESVKQGILSEFNVDIVRRPPGVRFIINKEDKILLTKEFRLEINDWDFRIPGGKVFDDIDIYLKYLSNPIELNRYVENAVIKEASEEIGIKINTMNFIIRDILGATLVWDLFYFDITDFEYKESGPKTEIGEIIYPEWFSYDEVRNMCYSNKISESRTVGVLLKYLQHY